MAQGRVTGIRLLYVEDEGDARNLVCKALSMKYPALSVHRAENGAVGLALFKDLLPEIVVTDLRMPVLDGIQMSREIKALSRTTHIVALTAYSDSPQLLNAIEIGINHYLLKPVNYEELFAVIDDILDEIAIKRLVQEQDRQLRERERQLSEAQKMTHLGSWQWDPATGVVTWSDELYRIMGYAPGVPVSYRVFLERIHPEDRVRLEKLVHRALQERQPAGDQYFRVVRLDGSVRIVRGQLEVVSDASGLVSLIGTCHDVTELKWAEKALRAFEQRFSRIFQAAPALLSIFSEEGSYLEVNEAFLQTLGYRREEVVGKSEQQLHLWSDPSQRERVLAMLEGEERRVRDVEVLFRAKSGREIVGLLSAEPIELNGRQSVLVLAKDITERKMMEEERARLASIVQSSRDAIIGTDAQGTVSSWNAGAEKIFNYAAAEVTGRNLSDFAPPEAKEQISLLYREMRGGRQVNQFETLGLRRDGRVIRISLTLSPIKDSGGRVVGASAIARDVTERAVKEEEIKHRAQHDTLTDLPNRQLFMDFLTLELAQARRNRKKLAVLFLDLNRFKQINDTFGHAAGDRLLVEVAQRLKRCVRESDTVARIGGDEFNVLMPDLGQTDDVAVVVKKIVQVFEKPFLLDHTRTAVGTSIGISVFPDDGETGEELIKKADSAMYVAKQSGGKTYQFHNADINARTLKREAMENLLRGAVEKGELELAFQPQVRLDSGLMVGAEALLRWHHPDEGLLLPAQFLGIAEESGTSIPIGEWVLRSACNQMKRWQEKGLRVAVNCSSRQFHQPDLVAMMGRALAETGLDPHLLELDLTENTIMEDADFSIRTMRQLADLGVTLCLDDFGIGSSSLQWIKKLPVEKVKIDRSFIKDILNERNDQAVVSAIISMAHNLGMKVHALGVESEAQLALIRDKGCDEAQGNLLSKPLAAADFEKLVVGTA